MTLFLLEKYEVSLSKASRLLSNDEMDILKFSLSLRSYSPKVQLFQQVSPFVSLPFYWLVNSNLEWNLVHEVIVAISVHLFINQSSSVGLKSDKEVQACHGKKVQVNHCIT